MKEGIFDVTISKIYFGPEFKIKLGGFLKEISKNLEGRILTTRERFVLYRVINDKFRATLKNRERVWNEWKQDTNDIAFHMDISIEDLDFMKDVKYVKDVHISVLKNDEKEYEKYSATISYGRDLKKEFCVSGERIIFRKFAFHNLFDALSSIGRVKPPNRGWIDVVLKNLFAKYDALSDREKERGFILPTGMKLHPDVLDEEEYQSQAAIFLSFKPINSKEWDILVVIGGHEDKPIKIEECVPRIYAKIERIKLRNALPSLAEKADKEDWLFKNDRYGALRYYIESVYDRLEKEYNENSEGCAPKKNIFAEPKNEHDAMVFCTGLVTPDKDGAHYIYAYCSSPDSDGVYQKIEWLSHGGTQRKRVCNSKLDFDDESVNHGLPYPPNWVSEPNRLLFDYRYGSITDKQIRFYESHIYANLRADPRDRGRLSETEWKQFSEKFPCYEEKKTEFKEYLYSAWRRTRKMLQKSFKVAIPTYYRGEIQLLVPLFLDEKNINQASVALVLTLDNKGPWHYFCPTCLSLEMARMDSRVITRIDDTWLKPDVKSSESMRQSSEGEEDVDWWDCELEQCGLW